MWHKLTHIHTDTALAQPAVSCNQVAAGAALALANVRFRFALLKIL